MRTYSKNIFRRMLNDAISFYYKIKYEKARRTHAELEKRLGSLHPKTIKYQRKASMTLLKIY